MKKYFSTLGSIKKIKSNFIGTQSSFVHDDSIKDLLGLDSGALYEKYNVSPNPLDIFSFDNIFLECDIAQGMIL